jgi:pyridinium-3,5-bisthiocarboxylic acid mononucleotide nickel chelatase
MPMLYLECATGLGGDMFLGAAADLGVDLAPLEDAFRKGGLECGIEPRRQRQLGLMGTRVHLSLPGAQPLRKLEDLLAVLERLELSEPVTARSRRALQRLAAVESRVHGIPLEQVHFHEIGGLDTLIDVAGAFWALERLEVGRVVSAPLPWFSGTVATEHGRLPLPAPATVELLKSKPVRPTRIDRELVTPTGALLIDQIVERFGDGPEGTIVGVGTGWGAMDLGEIPNGLRIFLVDDDRPASAETVWVLETSIDHLTGEELGGAIEALMESGALDVLFIPGIMKKSRPGGLLQVICSSARLESVERAVFAHTLSLGIRRTLTTRRVLPRGGSVLETRFGPLQSKGFELHGRTLLRPEFEALRRMAAESGLSPAQLRLLLQEPGHPEDSTE